MSGLAAGSGTAGRPRRDHVTYSAYASLSSYAWLLYATGAFLPLLRAEQGTDRTTMGLHGTAMSIGGLTASLLLVPTVRRLQRRGTFLAGALGLGLGIVALAVSHAPWQSISAMAVIGLGGSMLVNISNPILTAHHPQEASAVVTEANAIAAGVGLLSPVAIGLSQGLGWGWRSAVLLTVPLLLLTWALVHRVPSGTPSLDAQSAPREASRGRLGAHFWCMLASVILACSLEMHANTWGADLVAQSTGLSLAAAATASSLFVAGIALGRAICGPLARIFKVTRIYLASLGVIAVGWGILYASSTALPALAGLFVMGLGNAAIYPLGITMIYAAAGRHLDRAAGHAAVVLSALSITLPTLMGGLADHWTLHRAFLVLPVTVVLSASVALVAGRLRPLPDDAAALVSDRAELPVPDGGVAGPA